LIHVGTKDILNLIYIFILNICTHTYIYIQRNIFLIEKYIT
jgi:hypothetical protein